MINTSQKEIREPLVDFYSVLTKTIKHIILERDDIVFPTGR